MNTTVDFLGRPWKVDMWDGQNDPPITKWVSMDTETEPFVHGQPIKPVILQCYIPECQTVQIVPWQRIGEYIERLTNRNPDIVLVWHTFSFDYRACGHQSNVQLTDILVDEFHGMLHNLSERNVKAMVALADTRGLSADETVRLSAWVQRLEAMPTPVPQRGRLVDIALRYILNQMRNGEMVEDYRLETIAFKKLGQRLDKDDSLRLSFRQDTPLTPAQVQYAALDAIATGLIYETLPEYEATEDIQLFGDIVLSDCSWRGLYVDKAEDVAIRKRLQDRASLAEVVLNVFGVYAGEAGNNGVLQDKLRNIERRCGIRLPRTKGKFDKYGRRQLSLSKKAIDMFPENGVHPLVTKYKEYMYTTKVMDVWMHPDFTKVDGAVHTKFSPIKKTGRTSSSNPPIQNMPRGDGVRRRYRARPGHVIVATDYSQVELGTLGYTAYRRFGRSSMMEKINLGISLHDVMANEIKKLASKLLPGTDLRSLAKSLNFGKEEYQRL